MVNTNIINIIKNNEINKNNKIILKKSNKNINILLNILIKFNIIKYIIDKKKFKILILNFFKNKKLILKIKNLYKKSNIKLIKLKNLKKMDIKNKFFIISTNKGLLTNKEAINKKLGGIIVMILWN